MEDSPDVLIVGAGPVGLLLAAELRRDGVRALIIDQRAERSFFSKALGVTARTLEIFEDLGVADDAIDSGLWLSGVTAFNNGAAAQTMDIPAEGLPYGALLLAQFETERLLEACLHRHGGAVQYGWTLLGFSEDADGVLASLESAAGERREIRCRWLVGCDGAHSRVRRALELRFEGGQFPQTFILADLDVDWKLPRGRLYRFNASREGGEPVSLVAVPVHGSEHRHRLSTTISQSAATMATEAEANPLDLGQITAVMTPLLPAGTRLSSLRWASTYRISHRIVSSYSKGRAFLAGDAAHIHPPVGGQGMNTGLQDAHNLAWKLALAAHGLAGPALLESYSAERHPVGLDVVEQTSRAMNEVMAHQTKMPGIRETQLLIGYRGSPIVRDDRADAVSAAVAAGDRAPDAGPLRQRYVGRPIRLRERIGRGRHVLIGYVAEDGSGLDLVAGMLDGLRQRLGPRAAGFAIAPAGYDAPLRDSPPVLVDAGGSFQAEYGAAPGMVWMVRPDGHIGWCSDGPTMGDVAGYLANNFITT